MPEKTNEEFIESANKYKAKCIRIILDNNITVAPEGLDSQIFDSLRKIALEMEK